MSDDSTTASVKSTAAKPDLDWSQVKETVLMLRLAAAQIDFSLRDGNSSVDTLTDSFTSMASSMQAIAQASQQLFESCPEADELQQEVLQNCDQVSAKVQQARPRWSSSSLTRTLMPTKTPLTGSVSATGR